MKSYVLATGDTKSNHTVSEIKLCHQDLLSFVAWEQKLSNHFKLRSFGSLGLSTIDIGSDANKNEGEESAAPPTWDD